MPFEERSGSREEESHVGTWEDPTEGAASAKALGWILFATFAARSLVWLVCVCGGAGGGRIVIYDIRELAGAGSCRALKVMGWTSILL